jgi:hypothetical protein
MDQKLYKKNILDLMGKSTKVMNQITSINTLNPLIR